MGENDVTRGLPADLASVLRDQSVIVPQDAAVFELIASWAKAPTMTASAEVTIAADTGLFEALYRQTQLASSTTPAGCV
ncbi:MAG TPA: hypothetical protein VFL61_01640 [Gaiellaceae bacterium]|nr:hypothetical protein [Gaiellaceae bacterium]